MLGSLGFDLFGLLGVWVGDTDSAGVDEGDGGEPGSSSDGFRLPSASRWKRQ